MNPSSFTLHPDARARMQLLSDLLEDSARRTKAPGGVTERGTVEDRSELGRDEATESLSHL